MKPWCVLRFSPLLAEQWSFQRRTDVNDPSFVTTMQHHEEFGWSGDNPNADSCIFWCDTERDANVLASRLCALHTGNIYVVVKSTRVVRRDPGPEHIAIFNEKGLMPQ